MSPSTGLGNENNISTTDQVFRFHRYRAELARRQQQDQDGKGTEGQAEDDGKCSQHAVLNNGQRGSAIDDTSAAAATTTSMSTNKNSCVEDLSNVFIDIAQDGTVTITENAQQPIGIQKTRSHFVASNANTNTAKSAKQRQINVNTMLLLRNLDHCQILLHATLPTLHIVDISFTAIHIMGMITTSIHVTKAFSDSSLYLRVAAQQLRIHQAHQFTIYLGVTPTHKNGHQILQAQPKSPETLICAKDKVWNRGSIILEDSKQVTFVVPSKGDENDSSKPSLREWQQGIIKDFGWLRAGVPSPNFTIQQASIGHTETRDSQVFPTTENLADLSLKNRGKKVDSDDDDDEDEL